MHVSKGAGGLLRWLRGQVFSTCMSVGRRLCWQQEGAQESRSSQCWTSCVLASKLHAGWLMPDLASTSARFLGCEQVFTNPDCVGTCGCMCTCVCVTGCVRRRPACCVMRPSAWLSRRLRCHSCGVMSTLCRRSWTAGPRQLISGEQGMWGKKFGVTNHRGSSGFGVTAAAAWAALLLLHETWHLPA